MIYKLTLQEFKMDETQKAAVIAVEKLTAEIQNFKTVTNTELQEFKAKVLPDLEKALKTTKELEVKNQELTTEVAMLKMNGGKLVETEISQKDLKEMFLLHTCKEILAGGNKVLTNKTLDRFSNRVQALHKAAMTEGTGALPGTGATAVPTILSNKMLEDVVLASNVWKTFKPFPMTSEFIRLGKLTTNPTVYHILEGIAPTISSEALGSITLELKKMAAFSGQSYELIEDSVYSIASIIIDAQTLALAQKLDSAILNGDSDGTHMDTGGGYSSSSPEWMFDGLRKQALTNSPTDGGTSGLTYDMVITSLARLTKYGVGQAALNEVFFICPTSVYFDYLLLPEFRDISKVGAFATQLTGVIPTVAGFTVIPSAEFPSLVTSGFINASSGNTKKSFIIYNTKVAATGIGNGVMVEQDRTITTQVNNIVSSVRTAFKINLTGAVTGTYYS